VYCCGTILFGSLKAARSFLKLFAIECLSENMAISYSGKINSGQEFSFKTPYDAAEQGIFNGRKGLSMREKIGIHTFNEKLLYDAQN
jgi:hypothetical protein